MEQAQAFLEESDALAAVIAEHVGDGWDRPTQFKSWTVNDVLVHLSFWSEAADLAIRGDPAFDALKHSMKDAIRTHRLRALENARIGERGPALFDLWQASYRRFAASWAGMDPKRRVAWIGPEMSLRSAVTARQMETWAHGHEVFDLFGQPRQESDRIGNIVFMGVGTFGWSFQVNDLPVPADLPRLCLTAPSGEIWEFGSGPDSIAGSAVEFAEVVTQTRNIADTALRVSGPDATRWMSIAQCFAGPAEAPPAPGQRFVQSPGG